MALQLLPINESFNLKCDNASYMITLDGNRCKTKEMLLNELASIFKFPKHFGQNFDALYDCLTDLEWLGVDHIYFLIIHPALICADEKDNEPKEIFDVLLMDVLKAYQHNPMHFHLIAEKSFLKIINPN
jgi:hypothetical protein